jgi:hypothetical protein
MCVGARQSGTSNRGAFFGALIDRLNNSPNRNGATFSQAQPQQSPAAVVPALSAIMSRRGPQRRGQG